MANEHALFFFFKWLFLVTLCGLAPVRMVPLLLVVGAGCLRKVNPKMKGCGWGQASVAPRALPGGEERGESKADKGINISLRRVTCERLALNGGLRAAACSSGRDIETALLPPASFLLEISFASCARKISQGVMWAGKSLNTQMPRSTQQSVGEWQMIRGSWSSESSSKEQQGRYVQCCFQTIYSES